jgi:hypothetical protein
MVFLWMLMLMSLAIPTSVRAGIIYLEELLDITEKVPRRGTSTLHAANFGISSGTSWSAHAFQDDLSRAAISDDKHGLEVLGKDLFPFIEFSNIDPTELKEIEIELRFSGYQ